MLLDTHPILKTLSLNIRLQEFGLLLNKSVNAWIMFSNFLPFQHIDRVMEMIERGYRMECPDGCPQQVYNLMKDCWELDPKKRPTFSDSFHRLDLLCSSFL